MKKLQFTITEMSVVKRKDGTEVGGNNPKTGAQWYLMELKDENGERWAVPSFVLDKAGAVKGSKVEVMYDIVQNGRFKNKQVTSLTLVDKPLNSPKVAKNSTSSEGLETLKRIEAKLDQLLKDKGLPF